MTLQRADFRHLHALRARWAEVDLQGIVFNAHYLTYFDTALAEYWRALALPYTESMQHFGGDLYMRKATLDYLRSARYDDVLDVGIRCTRIGRSSLLFHGAVLRGGELLVSGELVYVFADPATQGSRPVPAALRELLEGFEAGQSMLELRTGDWATLGDAARAIRTEVFVQEQGIPDALEWDEVDTGAVHAVAYNRIGFPQATGRLLAQAPGIARIGRMAVRRPLRGGRAGRALLDELTKLAAARGDREIVLSAQLPAVAFYARAGFVQHGPTFEEAGIAHVEMRRSLLQACGTGDTGDPHRAWPR